MLSDVPLVPFQPAPESHLLDLNNSHETPADEFRHAAHPAEPPADAAAAAYGNCHQPFARGGQDVSWSATAGAAEDQRRKCELGLLQLACATNRTFRTRLSLARTENRRLLHT